VKTIPLTRGKVALVDDEDYERLSKFKWFARKAKHGWYASRHVNMHHEIVPAKTVDHRDGDGLNNQRSNLRPATRQQNASSRRKWSKLTSRFKGVSWAKDRRKWRAQIMVNRKTKMLGSFNSEIEAAQAYDEAARIYFRDFAVTNT
jgi:hypothetical protein